MKRLLLAGIACSLFSVAMFAQGGPARVRVLHASPDAPAVDVLVNGTVAIEGLPYREYTEYIALPAGTYDIRVNVSGTNTTVLQANPSLTSGMDYTVIAVGRVAAGNANPLSILLLTDDNTEPTPGQVKIRVVHGAPSAPAVDVYGTTPFQALGTPALTNVPFKAASGYLSLPISYYQFRVTPAGTRTVAINSGRVPTWGGVIRTVVAVDATGGGAPFDFVILPDRN